MRLIAVPLGRSLDLASFSSPVRKSRPTPRRGRVVRSNVLHTRPG
jgi:hypothetical protein